MTTKGDRRTFQNEDLVLRVDRNVNSQVWDETRYEGFLDELCGYREYQKEAIRTALNYLLSGRYSSLRDLAAENFSQNEEIQQLHGSWPAFERKLQLPDQLSCSVDQATGTGKSYVLYGLAAILLAEGAVDRVLVLCPSKTIEKGLFTKFKQLATNAGLRDTLPSGAKIQIPRIVTATETIVEGSICVENYHAILDNVQSSIRDSLIGLGSRVAVLNDETHHIANESGQTSKKWKEFLRDPNYGFRIVVGVSGTCYVGDEYFTDVVHRYPLRKAIEERFVKRVEYVDELPPLAERPEERWQLIYNRHLEWKKKLKPRGIRPLTIVVTRAISDAQVVAEQLRAYVEEWEELEADEAAAKVICVTSAARHQEDVRRLATVDSSSSRVEWIVSVSMLSEGWDVKNVFQIVPHEERAFNSKLLIAQVLGRGLRRPEGWQGEEPIVTVFNHDSWSSRIRHLVNEVLEIERRLSYVGDVSSPYNFLLHHLDYTRREDSTEYTKRGEYRLFEAGYVDLPTQVEAEDVTVQFTLAVTGEHSHFRTRVLHKTWSVEEIAEQMFQKLKSIDEESSTSVDSDERTNYAKRFPLERCVEIVKASLERAHITSEKITDDNRQRFWQALGPLRRKAAKRVVYKMQPKALQTINTAMRPGESCSAAELRRGAKTIFYTPQSASTLVEEQRDFFREVQDDDGDFVQGRVLVSNVGNFKTPTNLVIADGTPERKFIRELTKPEHAGKIDAWLKNSNMGFYAIEYAWKKGTRPKRGEFSPDFFVRQGATTFVVEIKGDDEIGEPSLETIKKFQYAHEHFTLLNEWLAGRNVAARYQFNMISPRSFNVFFQKLRDDELRDFRSELDVSLTKVESLEP